MKHPSLQSTTRLKPLVRGIVQAICSLPQGTVSRRLGWGALASVPGLALAGPAGESVVAGGIAVDRPDAVRTEIVQSTQNAIVNWQSFSIDGDELVLIQQPNASAAILNRVIGSQQSRILGQLQANGQVFLVNPQGVFVAPGATIDVGALALSALDIKDEDFMAENYVFAGANGVVGGRVENAGEITAADGGYVVLAGDYVNNSGVITAQLGTVVLAAGSQVTMDVSDGGLVGFAVDEQTVAELAGVSNVGEVIADGGRVVMTAKVANDLVATAVNNEGLVRAHRIVEQGGEVILQGQGGDVVHSGVIDVAGESGADGGRVIVHGDQDVIVDTSSQILATGKGAGNGGTVRVIADGRLDFRSDATIDAAAGSQGDRGGLVELSGHAQIAIRGEVNTGQGGAVLIDPAVLTIQGDSSGPHSTSSGTSGSSYGGFCPTSACVGRGFVEGQLNGGADVILVADQTIQASGAPFTINATSGSGDLTMRIATGTDAGFACTAFGVCDNFDTFAADPTGNINLTNVHVNMLGSFVASAGTNTGNVNLGNVTAANINMTAGSSAGNINVGTLTAFGSTGGEGTPGPASVTLAAAGNITLPGVTANTPGSSAGVSMVAGGTINVGTTVANGTSALVSFSGANVNINGLTNVTGTSFANLIVLANNNVVVNGAGINVNEAGGGFAGVFIGGNGTAQISAPISVNAGPGGIARVSLGSSEGPVFNDVFVNRLVKSNGAAGDSVTALARNNIITGPSGRLQGQTVRLGTAGVGGIPTITANTFTPVLNVGAFGNPANVAINNSAFGGTTTVTFAPGNATFRDASFLFSGNANFANGFTADNLLAGATNGALNFGGPVFITGARPFAPVPADANLFTLMANRGLTPPTHGPNVQLLGARGINITNPFTLGGPDPYIKFFSSSGINAPGLTSLGANTLAVFNPINLAAPIFFRNAPTTPIPGALNLFNLRLQGLPDNGGTTLAFGELGPTAPNLSGDVFIGPDVIDLGARNLFIITRGAVSGDNLISTTGVFEIVGLAAANVFEIPVVNEFDDTENDDEDDEDIVLNGDDGSDSDSDISEESNAESMECPA